MLDYSTLLLHDVAIRHNQTVLGKSGNIVENIPNVPFPVDDPTPGSKVPCDLGRKLEAKEFPCLSSMSI
jgi:hypothetical protein